MVCKRSFSGSTAIILRSIFSFHKMKIYLISFFFLSVLIEFGSGDYDCPIEKCRVDGPMVQFPFRLQGRHSDHCGFPGFDLYCSHQNNDTVLELPSLVKTSINNNTALAHSMKFIVKDINYLSQIITLSKLDECLPKVLPELNLSASPFRFQGSDYFTFLSCPSRRIEFLSNLGFSSPDMFEVPCLSRSNRHVYAVKTYASLYGAYAYESLYVLPLFSCNKMFNVSPVSPLIFEETIQLNWPEPACGHCHMKGNLCRLKNNGSSIDTACFPKTLYQVYMKKADSETGLQYNLMITGVVVGPCLVVLIVITYLQLFCSGRLKKEDQAKIEQFLEEYKALKPARYSYEDLKRVTANFTDKLGQGGYGIVYKGKLSNEVFVAVKVLSTTNNDIGEEFINEVGTIGRIHHVNVVRLVGYCAEGCKRALVYEFLPNESLEKYVSSRSTFLEENAANCFGDSQRN